MRLAPAACAVVVATWLATTVGPAYAHAVLVASSPGDGESVASPPTVLELEFSEPVVPIAVRLLDRQGHDIPLVAVEARDTTILARPHGALPPGGYFLSYRVTSLDAHAVGATLRFGIGEAAPGLVAGAEPSRAVVYLSALSRWLFYVTALASVGAALFASLVGPPEALARQVRKLTSGLAAAAVVATILRLGLSGLDLGGLPLQAVLAAEPWAIAAGTSLGLASAVAMAGLAILAHGCTARSLVVSGVGLVTLSFALTGHVASAPPRWLTGPAVTVHALCAGFWVGAFVPLLWGLRRDDPIVLLRRFSHLATVAVGGLLVTGATLAWIQLGGRPEGLLTTDYGWRLLLKLALVLMLLAIALVNRLVLTRAIADGRRSGASWLGRTLAMDIVLALAVLGVTATFPLSPPPRSAAAAEEGVTIVAPGRGGQATITLHPGGTGPNRLEAMVVDRDGLPIVARSAELFWSMPDAGIEPLRLAASLPLPGVVVAAPIEIAVPGRWLIRLDLLVDDFTKLSFEGGIDLR